MELNPELVSNPERQALLGEIESALVAFEQIRLGQRPDFLDAVGLHDDGAGEVVRVDASNVDSHELSFRLSHAWLCPDLIQRPV